MSFSLTVLLIYQTLPNDTHIDSCVRKYVSGIQDVYSNVFMLVEIVQTYVLYLWHLVKELAAFWLVAQSRHLHTYYAHVYAQK